METRFQIETLESEECDLDVAIFLMKWITFVSAVAGRVSVCDNFVF
jgi:hypothetical protein